jgi:hypothetical protein
MRGKYSIEDKNYIINLLNNMTVNERQYILNNEFDSIWQYLWNYNTNNSYKNEEKTSRTKFINLKSGYSNIFESYNLESLINLCDKKYLNSFTKPLFSTGLFSNFFGDLVSGSIQTINSSAVPNTSPQELLKVESKYGFNYNFMKDPQGFLQLLDWQIRCLLMN